MITFTIAFVAVLFLKVKGSEVRLPQENSPLFSPKCALSGSPRAQGVLYLCLVYQNPFCVSYQAKSLLHPQIITAHSSLEGG